MGDDVPEDGDDRVHDVAKGLVQGVDAGNVADEGFSEILSGEAAY